MSTKYIIPTPQSVSALLAMIFGDGVDTKDREAPELDGQHVATFVDDDDQLVALCVCDKEFVAYSGAALSMIPADVANEMISGNSISEAMLGNFYEVMNICSKLLMSDTSAHLRLDKTLSPQESAEPLSALKDSAQVIGFDIDIPKYGKGMLTFLVT